MKNNIELKEQRKINKSKRQLLAGALIGGAAGVWHEPLVTAVILPAHAQTSQVISFRLTINSNPIGKATPLLDMIIPKAYAGDAPSRFLPIYEVEATYQSANAYDVTIVEGETSAPIDCADCPVVAVEPEVFYFNRWSGTMNVGDVTELLLDPASCGESGNLNAKIIAVDLTAKTMTLQFNMQQHELFEGSSPLPELNCKPR